MRDFMEFGTLIALDDGWYEERDTGFRFRVDEDGNVFDEDGEQMDEGFDDER